MRTNEDRNTDRMTAADEVLDSALEQLRQEHRAIEAPKHLRALLQAETERLASDTQPSRNSFRMAWAWGVSLALLAALAWGWTVWERHGELNGTPKEVRSAPHSSPAIPVVSQPPVVASSTEKHGPEGVRHNMKGRETAPSIEDFLPLPASDGLPPASEVSLVRMHISTGALQQYGLNVPEGAATRTLLAEFVVGEDGLPRAIRIIP